MNMIKLVRNAVIGILCINCTYAYTNQDVKGVVNNLQLGYYCGINHIHQNWLDSPGDCLFHSFQRDMWLDANTLETVVNYRKYYSDSDYSIDDGSVSFILDEELTGVAPIVQGNDDVAWWALAMLRSYNTKPQNTAYLSEAKKIFRVLHDNYWDNTCGGGIWWDKARTYKNAITNELYLDLAINLYQATNNLAYLNAAESEANWFMNSGMINQQNLINDGLSVNANGQCVNNHENTWTYNQGVFLDGMANLSVITNNNTYHLQAVQTLNAVITNSANNLVDNNGILLEASNQPSSANTQFKGDFMRHLGYYLLLHPEEKASYCSFITNNANTLWNNRHPDYKGGVMFGYHWDCASGTSCYKNDQIDSVTTSSAIDLFNTAKICNTN